jgi:phage repressor protein C with HTH and peptisase S24 domain
VENLQKLFSRYQLIRVNGDSMAPTYKPGKLLLMRKFRKLSSNNRLKVNQILVITAPNFPDVWQVKRLKKINYQTNKVWVEGDNPKSTDSRSWGELDISNVVGIVLNLSSKRLH